MKLVPVVALGSVLALCIHAQRLHGTMTKVDDAFNGRRVVIQVGDGLQISLSENGSTGYQWTIPAELRARFAKTLREREHTFEAPMGPPGTPGTRRLHFEAIQAGSADLELHYRRSWEVDTPPARKFKLRVVARDGARK